MSKKRDQKKKRIRNEAQRLKGTTKVDEVIRYGTLEFARAGKYVTMRNTASKEEQDKIIGAMSEASKDALDRLEVKIRELQGTIKEYDPLELMHIAAYEAIGLLTSGKTESELSSDENYTLPGIEYLQYLIARTETKDNSPKISEDDWKLLWSSVKEALGLMMTYLTTLPPSKRVSREMNELIQALNLMRLMVRVKRFNNFQEDHWRASFIPYDNYLKEVYGVGAEDVIEGLRQLSDYQKHGVGDKYRAMMEASNHLEKRALELGLNPNTMDEREAIEYRNSLMKSPELKKLWEDANAKAQDALTVRVLDITDLSILPKSILSLLSIKPGEEPLYEITGPNHEDLSPISNDILHQKPFMEVDGRNYMFYHSGFEDRISEIIEADLNKKLPNKRTAIEKARSDYTENEAVELLAGISTANYKGTNLHYPNPDGEGYLTELDGLVEFDDVLLLVEVKSGAVSKGANRGAPDALETSLKGLIFEGQRQSERAERYIRSSDKVQFYDKTGKTVVHELENKMFRKIFRIVVTREQLGWVGASLARLSVMDPSLSDSMPWQISIDDLRVVADLFKDKGISFAHYLDIRLRAAKSKILSHQDELDHVALYNAFNQYHEQVEPDADRMTFNGYGLKIDRYFTDKLIGLKPKVPEQAMPREIRELIRALEDSGLPQRYKAGSFLLSGSQLDRKKLGKKLKKVMQTQASGRQIVVRRISNELGMSVSIYSEEIWEQERLRCALLAKNNQLEGWLAIRLETQPEVRVNEIVDIKVSDFTEEELSAAQIKLETDMAASVARLKPSVSESCPCGSGKIFKNCHKNR